MVVVMAPDATDEDVARVVERVEAVGGEAFVSRGRSRTIIGLVGDISAFHHLNLRTLPGVADVHRISDPFKLVSRQHHPERSTVVLGDGRARAAIGPDAAGPAVGLVVGLGLVEDHHQLGEAARMAAGAGAGALRGGVVRPRTGRTSTPPAGRDLEALGGVAAAIGLPLIVGVARAEDAAPAAAVAAGLRVGARQAGDEELLAAVGEAGRPVLLERPLGATIEEWLLAAEVVAQRGALQIVLLERGVRSAEPRTSATVDLAAVPLLQAASHLPVLLDASRAAGRAELVLPIARAALAIGADALHVEVHPAPEQVVDEAVWPLAGAPLRELAGVVRRVPRVDGPRRSPSAADEPAR